MASYDDMADDRRMLGVEPGQPDGDGTKAATASTDPGAAAEAPYVREGRIGTDLANVSGDCACSGSATVSARP